MERDSEEDTEVDVSGVQQTEDHSENGSGEGDNMDGNKSGSGTEEKTELSSSAIQERLHSLEQTIDTLRQENEQYRREIDRLKRDKLRKSIISVQQVPPLPSINESEEEVNEGPRNGDSSDQTAKMERFFQLFQTSSRDRSQLCLHGVNSLVSLHFALFANTDGSAQSEELETWERKAINERSGDVQAVRVAFNSMMLSIMQLNDRKTSTPHIEYPYPIQWLMSLFPYTKEDHSGPPSDNEWMPLHFALAVDTTKITNFNEYAQNIDMLLEEFGEAAFEQDVSPLCIAVACEYPSLEIVKLLVSYRSNCVRHPDEDGSLPIMHACACNEHLDVIEYLYELYPDSLKQTDSYGCSAIHYAAFAGCAQVVQFLLEKEPNCATMVEGNGALPLHDAVQNRRTVDSTEMVELLLRANPSAVKKRDDLGAFPLHKAAKSGTLRVFELVHKAFPKAIFAKDIEELLPMHYFAERHDKDSQLDLLQYILQANPNSKVLDDSQLYIVDPEPGSAGALGGWRKWFGGGSSGSSTSANSANVTAITHTTSTSKPAPPAPPSSSSPSKSAATNRRKSVRPISKSLHEYKR